MSDKHATNPNQATAEQQRQMQMGASPVPKPAEGAPVIELQAPEYFPDILPINILKADPEAAKAAAEAARRVKPAAPVVSIANVDDPTQPPHVPTPDAPQPNLYVAATAAQRGKQ